MEVIEKDNSLESVKRKAAALDWLQENQAEVEWETGGGAWVRTVGDAIFGKTLLEAAQAAKKAGEDQQRQEDFGPDGDGTTPGFFRTNERGGF